MTKLRIVGLSFLTVVIFAVFAALPFTVPERITGLKPNEFGDAFGSVNAFMSFLAFVGVLVTLAMQREELELQRNEMRESKEELKRSADAQKEMIEMQLCNSYLHGLSTLVQHDDMVKSSPVLREQPSETFQDVNGLRHLMQRIEEDVHRILFRRPVNVEEVSYGLYKVVDLFESDMKSDVLPDVWETMDEIYGRIARMVPALKESDDPRGKRLASIIYGPFFMLKHTLQSYLEGSSEIEVDEIWERHEKLRRELEVLNSQYPPSDSLKSQYPLPDDEK